MFPSKNYSQCNPYKVLLFWESDSKLRPTHLIMKITNRHLDFFRNKIDKMIPGFINHYICNYLHSFNIPLIGSLMKLFFKKKYSHQSNLLNIGFLCPLLVSRRFQEDNFLQHLIFIYIRFVDLGYSSSETFTNTHKAATLSLWQLAAKHYLISFVSQPKLKVPPSQPRDLPSPWVKSQRTTWRTTLSKPTTCLLLWVAESWPTWRGLLY